MPGEQEHCLVKKIKSRLTRHASRATAAVTVHVAVIAAADLRPRIDKDEVHEAKL